MYLLLVEFLSNANIHDNNSLNRKNRRDRSDLNCTYEKHKWESRLDTTIIQGSQGRNTLPIEIEYVRRNHF